MRAEQRAQKVLRARKIRQLSMQGKSMRELMAMFGISETGVRIVLNGKLYPDP